MKTFPLHLVALSTLGLVVLTPLAHAQTPLRSISPAQLQVDRLARGTEVLVAGSGVGISALTSVVVAFVGLNQLDEPGDTPRDFGITAAVTGGASLILLGVMIERIFAADQADYALTHLDSRVELRGRFNVSFFTADGNLQPLTYSACRGLGIPAAECASVIMAWDDDLPTLNRAIQTFRDDHSVWLERVQGDVPSLQSTTVFEQLTLREQRELGRDFREWMAELETDLNPSTYGLLATVGRIILGTASTTVVAPAAALRIGDSPVEIRPWGVAFTF